MVKEEDFDWFYRAMGLPVPKSKAKRRAGSSRGYPQITYMDIGIYFILNNTFADALQGEGGVSFKSRRGWWLTLDKKDFDERCEPPSPEEVLSIEAIKATLKKLKKHRLINYRTRRGEVEFTFQDSFLED